MSILNALVFGFIQGLTEYIPVSSSAHLQVLFSLFGINGTGFNTEAFVAFAHFGTIIAAIILYFKDFGEILFQSLEFAASTAVQDGKRRRRFPAVRLLIMMIFASVPLLLILPLNGYIQSLSGNTAFIGVMLILSGIILAISDHLNEGVRGERSAGISDAIIIGLCQAVSALPGISRTGTVYTAGIAVGLTRSFAAKFTVMLSVPVMFISNMIRLIKAASVSFSWSDLGPCFAGMAASLVGSILAIRIFLNLVQTKHFRNVGYYCWVAGVLAIILTMIF
jgi:undecaprenyl-diphosphatase